MKKIYFIFTIIIYQNLFCQIDSIKLIDEINFDLSIKNNLSWENYNKKINVTSLIFAGKGVLDGKYYKDGNEITFDGQIDHKKNGTSIYSSNSNQDKGIENTIEKLVTEIFNISNFYYFKSNKKGEKPYEEFSIQNDDNTWEFNTYKKKVKEVHRVEDKKAKRKVFLDNNGKIKKIITSLTHNSDILTQKHFQDHYIEIYLVPYGIKQKYSQIKGKIINVSNKNKIEFSITFP